MILHKSEILFDINSATNKIAMRFKSEPELASDIQTDERDYDLLIRHIDRCADRIRNLLSPYTVNTDDPDNKLKCQEDIVIPVVFPENSIKDTVVSNLHDYIVNRVLFDYLKLIIPKEAEMYKVISEESYERAKSSVNKRKVGSVKRSNNWL